MDRTVMGRRRIARARPAVAGAALLLAAATLGGCQATQPALTTPADSYYVAGGNFGRPWGGQPPTGLIAASATIPRLRGEEIGTGELRPEDGNVWPGPLPPRTTLANPDAALRGVPEYDPTGTLAPTSSMPPSGPPRGLPATSSAPTQRFSPPPASAAAGVAPPPTETMAPRADGRVVLTPNGPVVTTGGTDRIQSAISPGGQSSIVTRDGPFTTVTPIGGAPQPGVPQR